MQPAVCNCFHLSFTVTGKQSAHIKIVTLPAGLQFVNFQDIIQDFSKEIELSSFLSTQKEIQRDGKRMPKNSPK